ncbi:MAG: NAD(P)-dependent oxidoreductase [Gammaproteobacteria bacterium]|nr:NAD(P)-dependent oxidoreductase [Gammaproteobacteria bacterium]
MKILLTGGSSDLATVLSYQKRDENDEFIRLDIRKPKNDVGTYIEGSILDRSLLNEATKNVDCIIHIAAWHGFHEITKEKNVYDFWDLNVTGTFNVFQSAVENNVDKIIYISSESVEDLYGIYGHTKVIGEQIAETYAKRHNNLSIITLRPGIFIPHWNEHVYNTYIEWVRWFWKGAVHINDVAQAVKNSIDFLEEKKVTGHIILPVDGAYEYTSEDLASWDAGGSGSTFKKHYAQYVDLIKQYDLDPSIKPTIQDITRTTTLLNYHPQYSLRSLLGDLEKYGPQGPSGF